MFKFSINFEELISLIKNSFIPAIILGFGLLNFYARTEISETSQLTLHYVFYALSFTSFLILLYFNQSKPVFLILTILLSYILINYIKKSYGAEYLGSAAFVNLCFFAPINLAFFYFYPNHRLMTKENVYLLLGIFTQFAITESLCRNNIKLGYNFFDTENSNLNGISTIIFLATIIAAFIRTSLNGRIASTALFFAIIEIFLGYYYSASPTALTIFFSIAALTVTIAIVQDVYYSTYKDVLTGLASRNSYIVDTKGFPLKYSIGIICIDDYERLSKVFGRFGIDALTKMIANRIVETEIEEQIYRYSEDEFVIVFKNEDKNTGYERLEKIRRNIASAEFILNPRRKALKLTVSCSISEKKRSDANSYEVLVRAHKAILKAHQFSQNITSKT